MSASVMTPVDDVSSSSSVMRVVVVRERVVDRGVAARSPFFSGRLPVRSCVH